MPNKGAKVSPSDEETAVETPKEPEKQVDPQEAKAKKQKESKKLYDLFFPLRLLRTLTRNLVLFVRYKLQQGFLSRDQAPKEEEMAIMSNYITKLEAHADLEVSIIRATKINKVLKAIVKLDSIPKDEEYQFRRRSTDILAKWKNRLQSDVPLPAPGPAEAESDVPPPTPGPAEANLLESDVPLPAPGPAEARGLNLKLDIKLSIEATGSDSVQIVFGGLQDLLSRTQGQGFSTNT